MKESVMKTGSDKRCMGLWLLVLGGLFAAAILVGKGTDVNRAVLAYGFLISFFLVFLNKKLMNRFRQGEWSKMQQRIADFSIPFFFLLMFFLVSPFFKILGTSASWALAFSLTGIHYLVLSLLYGKSMLLLGGLVFVNAVLLLLKTGLPAFVFLYGHTALLIGFGIFLFVAKEKGWEAEKETKA